MERLQSLMQGDISAKDRLAARAEISADKELEAMQRQAEREEGMRAMEGGGLEAEEAYEK